MISKNTMTDVALGLAKGIILKECAKLDGMFLERCELLDSRLASSLKEAFDGEKISQARMQRIVDKFCDNMLDSKKTDAAL